MKKQTLLGAIALTTLAVGAAGAANAQQYTVVSNGGVAGATVKAPITVATEAKVTTALSTGVIGLSVVPSASAILPGGNSLLSFTLTGGHTFSADVTPGAIVANAGCAPTTTVSSGGTKGSSTVTFLISGLGGCTNAVPITAAIPALLGNRTTALGVSTTFKTELGTAIDGGSANYSDGSTDKLNAVVKFGPAFSLKVTPDTVITAATLASGFKTLTVDVKLGAVALAVATTSTGISTLGVADVSSIADVTKVDYKFVGTQSDKAAQITVDDGGSKTVPTTGLYSDTSPQASTDIGAISNNTNPIPASAYTVETALTVDAAYNAPAVGPSALQSITREGATYLIPWVASGTTAQASGNSTVIRIANIGTAATGPVTAELLNASTGNGAIGALLPIFGTIAAGKDFVVTGASLQSAFGADFGRGDVRITVEAQPATIVTRRFIQNVTGGGLTEVSLGRDAAGNEPTN